jgi:FdhD protein
MTPPRTATHGVEVVRVRQSRRGTSADRVAVEEPLEIRIHGRPFAVIMRTPGADRELSAGFLLSERVLRAADDLGAIEHCRDGGDGSTGETRDNVVNVTLADSSRAEAVFATRRNVATNSACGLCGRTTIESLASDAGPIQSAIRISAASLLRYPALLRDAQTVFAETGGLHAAGLFSAAGALLDAAEDVGRHNAVDKVVGRQLLREALPLSGAALFVSGRTSYEIVQKALYGGVPVVASVSAPSSLAIELADAMGITLAGFVRGDAFNIYTHPERIQE